MSGVVAARLQLRTQHSNLVPERQPTNILLLSPLKARLHPSISRQEHSTDNNTDKGTGCLQCLTDSWESHAGLDTSTACGARVLVGIITSLAAIRVSTTLLQPSNRPMKCSQRSKSTLTTRASKSPFRQYKNKTLPRSVPGQSKDRCGLGSYSDMRPWKKIVVTLPDNWIG